jgi:hypothetical protein
VTALAREGIGVYPSLVVTRDDDQLLAHQPGALADGVVSCRAAIDPGFGKPRAAAIQSELIGLTTAAGYIPVKPAVDPRWQARP